MDLPTPETHPDFPLWKLGYTPQEVYDAFFPKHFRFIGNPDRPSVCGTFGLRKERLWRFEYVVDVDKGEDPVEMATYDKMAAVIFPYLTHPGKTYGYVNVLTTLHRVPRTEQRMMQRSRHFVTDIYCHVTGSKTPCSIPSTASTC